MFQLLPLSRRWTLGGGSYVARLAGDWWDSLLYQLSLSLSSSVGLFCVCWLVCELLTGCPSQLVTLQNVLLIIEGKQSRSEETHTHTRKKKKQKQHRPTRARPLEDKFQQIAKNEERRGKEAEATRRTCRSLLSIKFTFIRTLSIRSLASRWQSES